MIGRIVCAWVALLGYRRVSRVGDRADTLISPDLQADVIEAYASQRGVEVEMLEAELDVSGGKVKRPILEAALERIEAGTASGLIVDTLDRLSRMAIFEALGVIRRVEAAGGQVIAVSENFDAGTPEGRLVRNMFLSIGEMQRERYGGKIAASKRSAVERGIWPTHRVPIGYRMKPREGAKNGPLEPDPEWGPKVVRAFELRAGGASWRPIADLLDRGLSGASKVIANRVYLGEVRLKIAGELVVNRSAHEPLVSRALWEAAQVRHPRPAHKAGQAPALLAGVARCAGCQGALTRSSSGGWTAYRCVSRRAGGECPARAIISVAALDEYVQAIVLPHLEQLQARSFERVAETEDLEVELIVAEQELEDFQAAVSVAELGVERFASGLRERAAVVDSLRLRLGQTRHDSGAGVFERDVGAIWDELGVGERGQVLRGALGVVWVWQGSGELCDRVKVIAAGFEGDLPRPGGKRFAVGSVEWSADLAAGELRLPGGEDGGEG